MILEIRAVPPFMKNGFVVGCEDTREGVIIDPGDEVDLLLDDARQQGIAIKHILLTHAHLDHITGVGRAKAVTGAPVWLHRDDNFLYRAAVQQGIAKNPSGQRFFVLAIPPETRALLTTATGPLAATRDRAVAAGAVLFVCQRDIDNGKIAAANLAPGVVAGRGWPPVRTDALPKGARYFNDEDPANLPASNHALRKLRSTCAG